MAWWQWWQNVVDSELVQQEFQGYPVWMWGWATVVFLASLSLLRLSFAFIRRRAEGLAERRGFDAARVAAGLAARTKWWFLFSTSFFLAAVAINLPRGTPPDFVKSVTITALLLQIAIWTDVVIVLFLERYMKRRLETDAASVTMMSALAFLGRVVAWTAAVLLILENQGAQINSLVAGLGIGGVAVALAAQNVLGDLFAALSIVLDRPFILGDFIAVDDFLGSIEHIGLKTTRLRSLSGEQLIFSNADLLHGRIRNYKRMYERRIQFSFGVEYGTSHDKLAALPGTVREAITAQQRTRFDRAHFKAFGDSSLLFEVVYYVLSPDYNLYMDIQQAINLTLVRRLAEDGIEFAFPTQTLYVHKVSGNGLADSSRA
jgi:small-conductance mechanosensitive channel